MNEMSNKVFKKLLVCFLSPIFMILIFVGIALILTVISVLILPENIDFFDAGGLAAILGFILVIPLHTLLIIKLTKKFDL